MVNRRSIGSMAAALSLFCAFPALSSAHTLAVSASPSRCVTPLTGQYTATVTVTETYFSGTTENIAAGQNVRELSSSTDAGNTGLNQNYFTQGAVGTQTGPISLGQPTSFTSPSNGSTATQQFTVTTSVPETYVLGNSYMRSPSSVTITAPAGGCTPPPPACPSGQSLVGGTCVPPTLCPADESLSGGVCVLVRCVTGQMLASGQCVPPTSCPSGETLSGALCVPPTACPAGQSLSGGRCVPPTTCPAGDVLTDNVCVQPRTSPAVCRASTGSYKVRAGRASTITVSVQRQGAPVANVKVSIQLPGGKVVTRATSRSGLARFTVKPTRAGTILMRSLGCTETVKVKVYSARTHRSVPFTG